MNNTHIFLCDIYFYCDKNTYFLYLHSTRRIMTCILQSHKYNSNVLEDSSSLWNYEGVRLFFPFIPLIFSSFFPPSLASFFPSFSHMRPFLLFDFWTSHWYIQNSKTCLFSLYHIWVEKKPWHSAIYMNTSLSYQGLLFLLLKFCFNYFIFIMKKLFRNKRLRQNPYKV